MSEDEQLVERRALEWADRIDEIALREMRQYDEHTTSSEKSISVNLEDLRKWADALECLQAELAQGLRERQEMIVERDDCLEELAEARAEIAAWERKFGGRIDYPDPIPHRFRPNDKYPMECTLCTRLPSDGIHQPTSEAERRVVEAATNYIKHSTGSYTLYIRENGLWGKSPWAELVQTVEALAAQQQETGK